MSHFLGNRRFVAHDHPVDISAIAGNRFLRRVLQNEIIMGNEKSQRKKKKNYLRRVHSSMSDFGDEMKQLGIKLLQWDLLNLLEEVLQNIQG